MSSWWLQFAIFAAYKSGRLEVACLADILASAVTSLREVEAVQTPVATPRAAGGLRLVGNYGSTQSLGTRKGSQDSLGKESFGEASGTDLNGVLDAVNLPVCLVSRLLHVCIRKSTYLCMVVPFIEDLVGLLVRCCSSLEKTTFSPNPAKYYLNHPTTEGAFI
jgi:hypothetical protein